jgi:hypothetical protein
VLNAWTAFGGRVSCSPPEDTGGVNWPAVFCWGEAERRSCERERPGGGSAARARPGAGGVRAADEFPHSLDARSVSADRVTLAEATRIPPGSEMGRRPIAGPPLSRFIGTDEAAGIWVNHVRKVPTHACNDRRQFVVDVVLPLEASVQVTVSDSRQCSSNAVITFLRFTSIPLPDIGDGEASEASNYGVQPARSGAGPVQCFSGGRYAAGPNGTLPFALTARRHRSQMLFSGSVESSSNASTARRSSSFNFKIPKMHPQVVMKSPQKGQISLGQKGSNWVE